MDCTGCTEARTYGEWFSHCPSPVLPIRAPVLQERVLVLWFPRRQMSDSHSETREGLEVSAIGEAPSLTQEVFIGSRCQALCSHGQPSPFPGRRSGAESSSGPTIPRASALTSFLSTGYYGIFQCSAIWYLPFITGLLYP